VAQGQKFDPNGDYIRRWIPELAQLSAKFVHQPWTAPPEVLLAARVILGRTYPRPIVDHREARQRALEAFASLSK
jgi:deoxyribodipyrimidine photo-lyase